VADHDLPPWFELARRALTLAAREDYIEAGHTVTQLGREHGADAVPGAMQCWADTALSYQRPPKPGQTIRLAFLEVSTGRIGGAGGVPPAKAWAGQFLAARAADDPAMCEALIKSVRGDAEWSERVGAVLQMCGLGVRAAIKAGRQPQPWPEIRQPSR
jgi:hypothetical protein